MALGPGNDPVQLYNLRHSPGYGQGQPSGQQSGAATARAFGLNTAGAQGGLIGGMFRPGTTTRTMMTDPFGRQTQIGHRTGPGGTTEADIKAGNVMDWQTANTWLSDTEANRRRGREGFEEALTRGVSGEREKAAAGPEKAKGILDEETAGAAGNIEEVRERSRELLADQTAREDDERQRLETMKSEAREGYGDSVAAGIEEQRIALQEQQRTREEQIINDFAQRGMTASDPNVQMAIHESRQETAAQGREAATESYLRWNETQAQLTQNYDAMLATAGQAGIGRQLGAAQSEIQGLLSARQAEENLEEFRVNSQIEAERFRAQMDMTLLTAELQGHTTIYNMLADEIGEPNPISPMLGISYLLDVGKGSQAFGGITTPAAPNLIRTPARQIAYSGFNMPSVPTFQPPNIG